jgi:hypothetical protein
LTKSGWLFCFSEASLLAGANKQKRQLMRSIRKRLRAAQHSWIGEANPVSWAAQHLWIGAANPVLLI